MKYRYLLIDNDNTLMDFHAAEHAAGLAGPIGDHRSRD